MSVFNNESFITQLSDFWVNFYQDYPVLDAHLNSVSEVVKNHYFRVLQKELPQFLDNYPIFREEFWNIIELDSNNIEIVKKEDGREFFAYALDEAYANVPFLYNIIYSPTVVLRQGEDYLIERKLNPLADSAELAEIPIVSRILFKRKEGLSNGDPFTNNSIPKRVTDDNRLIMALYAPKSFIDDGDLNKEWGHLLSDFNEISSDEYAMFLEGLLRLYVLGPSVNNLNAGLTLAAGYPVAREDDVIISVELYIDKALDINEFILTSAKGRTYTVKRKIVDFYKQDTVNPQLIKQVLPTLKLTSTDFSNPNLAEGVYETYFPVKRGDSFISDIRISDSLTEPYWWRSKSGSLSQAIVSTMSDQLRTDRDTIDFLFDNYLKFNTFGVFIDYRVLRPELQLSNKFLNLMLEIKPTFKSFLVYENDLQIVSIMGAGDTLFTQGEGYAAGVRLDYRIVIEDFLNRDHFIHQNLPLAKASIYDRIDEFSDNLTTLFYTSTNTLPTYTGGALIL